MIDDEACFRAARSKDKRFDGMFYVAVTSTRIYCRPSCPARPQRVHMRFLPTAASAQAAGYRACKRCRPDASPGSPDWNVRGDLVARAMRLIKDGVVEREGVPGLAAQLGYSERQLRRQMSAEIGAGPLALARAERAQTARTLLEASELSATDIAFAAGFSSVRQFNETMRAIYAGTPSELRAASRPGRSRSGEAGANLNLRLSYRTPFAGSALLAFLARRALPGVEEQRGECFARVLDLPYAPGTVQLHLRSSTKDPGFVHCQLALGDVRDLPAAVARCRRLLDLDADPLAIEAALGSDAMLAPLVRAWPGLRVAGSVQGNELAVRALLGQQVSVSGARTLAARLVANYGKPLAAPLGGLRYLFPSAEVLASLDPDKLGLPKSRAAAFLALNRALAEGRLVLGPGAAREECRAALLAIAGIGTWTASYIAMRALGDPDAFVSTDLGLLRALGSRGVALEPRDLEARSEAWRPWRAYAVQYLWAPAAPGRKEQESADDQ